MKRYWKRILILTCAPVVAWLAMKAQSNTPSAPFAFTQFIPALDLLNVKPNVVLLARKSDNSYVQIGYRADSPFSLFSAVEVLDDLLSGGFNTFINSPPGPANVGRASQPVVGGKFSASGLPGVAMTGTAGITVYLGSTSLLFTGSTDYKLGNRATQVISADFNGDNAPDLAAIYTEGDSTRVAVLINQGAGTFNTPVNYLVGTSPKGLASLDLNGDGHNDLVAVGDASVFILFGNANGTFQNPVAYPAGTDGLSVTIADVNGDGFPDLVSTANDRTATVLLNNGNGTFRPGSTFATGAGPAYIAAGDFNSDTRMDLAIANQAEGTVSVFLGLGNGSFQFASNYYVTVKASSLVITDYDRDGNLDIINGYGDARMIGAGDDTVNIDIIRGNGDGSFRALFGVPASTAVAGSFLTMGDFNGDGIPDSVIGDFFGTGGRNLYYFAGRANGVFQAPTPISLGSGQILVKNGASGDFDGDGKADLAVTHGAVSILLNTGAGFGPPSTFSSGGSGADGIAAADLNGDGKLDLAVANTTSGNTAVFFGGGNGAFQLQQTYPTGANPSKVAVADLNGDGKPDLMTTATGFTQTGVAGAVYVLINNGDGTFQAPRAVSAGSFPVQATTADINADGIVDLIVATADSAMNGKAAVLRGLGGGNFAGATLLAAEPGAANVAVSDFNADGALDIVVSHCCNTVDLAFLAGNGDGTFAPFTHFNGGTAQIQMLAADLNRDGRQDLVIAANPATVRTLMNTSAPAVTPCGYILAPSVAKASVSGGAINVTVQAGAGCPWAVSGLPSWVTVSGAASGAGPGTVRLVVAANTGLARTATVLIAGLPFAITQPGIADCVYTLSPGGQAFPANGGTQSISITTTPNCSWSITGQPAWISFPEPPAGSGSGTVVYKAAGNNSSPRSAGMLVAGTVFVVEQASSSTVGLSNQGSLTHLTSAGTWKMTMNYINTNQVPSNARVSFFDDNGDPLSIPLTFPQVNPGAPPLNASVIDRTIDPGAQLIMDSTGPDSQQTAIGSGQLLAPPGVMGFGIFSNPALKWEALVPLETRSTNSYLLAFDNTAPVATGVAIANQTGASVDINVLIRDENGNQFEARTITLVAHGHSSFLLNEKFLSTAGIRGTVEFDTPNPGAISMIGLRANGPALTTLPVLANIGSTGGTITHVTFNGGFSTTFTLLNSGPNDTPVSLNFFDDDGNSLGIPVFFPQTGASTTTANVVRTLPPHSVLIVETRGSDSLPAVSGAATVTTNGPIGGFAIFHWIPFGQEASVPMEARDVTSYLMPFDNTAGLVTGLAMAGGGAPATAQITIRSEGGALLQTSSIDLPTQGHLSFLLTDMFQVTKNRRGTMQFDVPPGRGVSILGLRAKSDGTLTTVPILAK